MAKESANNENTVLLELTPSERKLLLDVLTLPSNLEKRIRFSPVKKGKTRFRFSIDELEELAECVASEANHAESEKDQKVFDQICDRIEGLLNRHYGQKKVPSGVMGSLIEGMQGQEFESMEEAQRAVDIKMEKYNHSPQKELGGLSPTQAGLLIYCDWDDPNGPLTFNETLELDQIKSSRFFYNCRTMLSTIVDLNGVKLTPKGYLNRKFVRQMFDSFIMNESEREIQLQVKKIYDEFGTWDVAFARALLNSAGFVRKHKKMIIPTRAGKYLLQDSKEGKLFARLFKSGFQKLNLGSLDPLKRGTSFQDGIAYSIYQAGSLHMEWAQPKLVKHELFLPYIKEQLPPPEKFIDPLEHIAKKLVLVPLAGFGLLERREQSGSEKYPPKYEYKKSPLFDSFLRFNLDNSPEIPPEAWDGPIH